MGPILCIQTKITLVLVAIAIANCFVVWFCCFDCCFVVLKWKNKWSSHKSISMTILISQQPNSNRQLIVLTLMCRAYLSNKSSYSFCCWSYLRFESTLQVLHNYWKIGFHYGNVPSTPAAKQGMTYSFKQECSTGPN